MEKHRGSQAGTRRQQRRLAVRSMLVDFTVFVAVDATDDDSEAAVFNGLQSGLTEVVRSGAFGTELNQVGSASGDELFSEVQVDKPSSYKPPSSYSIESRTAAQSEGGDEGGETDDSTDGGGAGDDDDDGGDGGGSGVKRTMRLSTIGLPVALAAGGLSLLVCIGCAARFACRRCRRVLARRRGRGGSLSGKHLFSQLEYDDDGDSHDSHGVGVGGGVAVELPVFGALPTQNVVVDTVTGSPLHPPEVDGERDGMIVLDGNAPSTGGGLANIFGRKNARELAGEGKEF